MKSDSLDAKLKFDNIPEICEDKEECIEERLLKNLQFVLNINYGLLVVALFTYCFMLINATSSKPIKYNTLGARCIAGSFCLGLLYISYRLIASLNNYVSLSDTVLQTQNANNELSYSVTNPLIAVFLERSIAILAATGLLFIEMVAQKLEKLIRKYTNTNDVNMVKTQLAAHNPNALPGLDTL